LIVNLLDHVVNWADEMLTKPIALVLDDDSHVESAKSRDLRHKAAIDVQKLEGKDDAELFGVLQDTLVELITQVIKPLFSRDQHANLTSTGRKNLVNNSLPAAINRFSNQVLFDDDNRPAWKNGWTPSLLTYVLESYARLRDRALRKKTLEAHFHLLIPPILHQIDDVEIVYKVGGCRCLKILCDNLSAVQSGILKRTGLMDVFVEALKNDFLLLPTLTPEEDSLMVFQELYPAFSALVQARFVDPTDLLKTSTRTGTITNVKGITESEEDLRQSYLTLLLRHQLLHSLSHLSTGSGAGSTTSVKLSTFLLSQLRWIFEDMGLSSVVHLQAVLPVLRNVMSDPFATAAPDMLLETTTAMQVIVQTCWPRIRDKWLGEYLRGLVACWLNVTDDEADNTDNKRVALFEKIKHELKILACLLEDVSGQAFVQAKNDLIREESALEVLFDGNLD